MSKYNDLKNIGKKEYVEKESLAKHIDNSFGEISTPFVVKEIRNFPVSDVVEVVRCKDCKYLSLEWIGDDLEYICKCGSAMINITPNSYCSYGKRSEKGETMSTLEKAVATYGKDMQIKQVQQELGTGGRTMKNLNAEKIYKELAMFIEDMPTDLHLGFKRTAKFREFLKDALSLIKSQEQKIFDLENRLKECENGYKGTLYLESCKLRDAEEKINELGVDLKTMRGAANSYKIHITELTQAHEMLSESYNHLEKTKDELLSERARLTEENERLHASCTELEKKYALAVAEREANVKGFSKMLVVIHDDTVRKMQERLTKEFDRMHKSNFITVEERQWIIDQIAKEMIGEEK